MSSNQRSDREPMINSDGEFVCTADNKTFNTRAEYDKHCASEHMQRRNR